MNSNSEYMSIQEHLAQLTRTRELAHAIALHTTDGKYAAGDARNAFHVVASNSILYHCITVSALLRASSCSDPVAAIVGETLILLRDHELQEQFWGGMRRHLFLDVWCAFEDTLRVLYEHVVSEEQRKVDKKSGGKFIGIPTVWASVAQVVEQTNGAASDRRYNALVRFLASTRNTIHSNSFYKGDYRSLELDTNIKLELIDGQPTDFLSLAKLPRLIRELVGAADYLRQGLVTFPRVATPIWIHEKKAHN